MNVLVQKKIIDNFLMITKERTFFFQHYLLEDGEVDSSSN